MSEVIKDSVQILNDYRAKDSTIDCGNLYYAGRTLEAACSILTERITTSQAEVAELRGQVESLKFELEAEIKVSRKISFQEDAIKWQEQATQLRESNIGLCEALRFYADEKSWCGSHKNEVKFFKREIINTDVEEKNDWFSIPAKYDVGGKTARAALARFGLGK